MENRNRKNIVAEKVIVPIFGDVQKLNNLYSYLSKKVDDNFLKGF